METTKCRICDVTDPDKRREVWHTYPGVKPPMWDPQAFHYCGSHLPREDADTRYTKPPPETD